MRIILAILMIFVSSLSYAEMPPQANLVAHYKMNDNAASTAVADNRGSYNGVWSRNTSLDSIAGKINTALYCNNANYCLVPDNAAFSFTTGSADLPFSISFWAYLDTFEGNDRLIAKANVAGGVQEYVIAPNSGATTLNFIVYKGDNSAFRICSVPKASVPTGQWIYITATYDGTGGASGGKVYINAVQRDGGWSTSGTYTCMQDKNLALALGADSTGGAGYRFDGALDDVRIYNIALSEAQITSLYNAGNGTEDEIGSSPARLYGCRLYNCTLR